MFHKKPYSRKKAFLMQIRSFGKGAPLIIKVPQILISQAPKMSQKLVPISNSRSPRQSLRIVPPVKEIKVSSPRRPLRSIPQSARFSIPPNKILEEVIESMKIEIKNGNFFDKKCPICRSMISVYPIVLLSCGHYMHSHCFVFHRRGGQTCPICHKSATLVSIEADAALNRKSAVTIQRVFRGFLVRQKVRPHLPVGSVLHKKWVIGRAKVASKRLINAIEIQSDTVDAVLTSIDHELEWSRNIMSAIEAQEKTVDWEEVKKKCTVSSDCPICLRMIDPHAVTITSCGHCFHTECLQTWIAACSQNQTQAYCPVCRSFFQYKQM